MADPHAQDATPDEADDLTLCEACGEPIQPGEEVAKDADDNLYHVRCCSPEELTHA